MTAWLAEMFLDALSVDYVTVTAGMSTEHRAVAVARFTDPSTSCQVLLTT